MVDRYLVISSNLIISVTGNIAQLEEQALTKGLFDHHLTCLSLIGSWTKGESLRLERRHRVGSIPTLPTCEPKG